MPAASVAQMIQIPPVLKLVFRPRPFLGGRLVDPFVFWFQLELVSGFPASSFGRLGHIGRECLNAAPKVSSKAFAYKPDS